MTTHKLTTLSPEQKLQLERKCNASMNWSDGGNWIGSGPQPPCFDKEVVANRMSHTLHFRTDQAADKWNREWEKAIRHTGHLATAAITATVTLATSGIFAPIAAGLAAAVAKDEFQAKVAYPEMSRGWSFQTIIENEFIWKPIRSRSRGLTQRMTFVSLDSNRVEVRRTQTVLKFSLDELPEVIAREIASARSRSTESNYV